MPNRHAPSTRLRAALACAVLLASASVAWGESADALLHFPDLAATSTVTSVADGDWSSPATWSPARVPGAGDRVAIATAVAYGAVSDAAVAAITVRAGGRLAFRTDRATRLTVGSLRVREGGAFTIGTLAAPIPAELTAELVFADIPLDIAADPEQTGTGLVGYGVTTMVGAAKTSFTRLAGAEPRVGDTTLVLGDAVSGWRVGDRVLLPDSRQLRGYELGANYVDHTEIRAIAGIASDRRSIALDAPLAWDHPGAHDGSGALKLLPHVASLTRNIVVRSANPGGTRGHVLFTERAEVDLRWAQFDRLGRTLNIANDSVARDASGNVTHIGTNQIGRYPLHLHMLNGRAGGDPSGHQFTVLGTSFDCGAAIVEAPKWGIVVHGSHYGLIQDNVVYRAAGSAITTEDGSESFNVFARNFVCRVPGNRNSGGGIPPTDNGSPGGEGSGYWFRGVNNWVRDNVSAGQGPDSSNGFKYHMLYLPSDLKIPAAPGEMPSLVVDMKSKPVLEFARNESYGATPQALAYFWLGTDFNSPWRGTRYEFADFTMWNFHDMGIFGYPASGVTLRRLTSYNDPLALTQQLYGAIAVTLNDYYTRDFAIVDSVIEGAFVGYDLPNLTEGTQIVRNSRLWNANSVSRATMWTVNANSTLIGPRRVLLDHVVFDPRPLQGGTQPVAIRNRYNPDSGHHAVQLDELVVRAHDGVAGDDFRVYYDEQAPDAIVPETRLNGDGSPNMFGAPIAGLTNAQCWARFGIAAAGEVAPRAATARAGIVGGVVAAIGDPGPDPAFEVAIQAPQNRIALPAPLALAGIMRRGPASPNARWTTLMGPAPAVFAQPTALVTTATFSVTGYYVLRLTIDDGTRSAHDEIGCFVEPATGGGGAPSISGFDALVFAPGAGAASLPFVIGDAETPPDALALATGGGTGLVTTAITGSGAERRLIVTPLPGRVGFDRITVNVSDGAHGTSSTFAVTLLDQVDPGTGAGETPTGGSGTTGGTTTGGGTTGTATGGGGTTTGSGATTAGTTSGSGTTGPGAPSTASGSRGGGGGGCGHGALPMAVGLALSGLLLRGSRRGK